MNILVVDDDEFDRTSIRRILKQNTSIAHISEAATVSDGFRILDQSAFDVILLDYRMPQVDGLEMVISLRKRPNLGSTAIVMMSNSINEQLALDCLQAGAQDFIPKSEISAQKLQRCILQANKRFEMESKLFESYGRVKQLAETDSLTGLSNRYHFEERLKLILEANCRCEALVVLLLLDLDHFKYVNDTFGHETGDELLKEVVKRITKSLRGSELFARLGGDEFAIVLNNAHNVSEATKVARRILKTLGQEFIVKGMNMQISGSIGIALHPQNGKTAEELTKFADIAMYRAKNLGRGQICFFEDKMQKQFFKNYQIELDIRKVLQQQQFHLHYQPVVLSNSSEIVGFEALIRWPDQTPHYRPDEFIPVAEESRTIDEIGRLVLAESIAQLSRWNEQFNQSFSMAINLSPVQLHDETLVDFMLQHLQQNNIDPINITIELTETALFGDDSQKKKLIQKISDLGCRIALDDFGTGFSSVSHLLNFPIDIVKIDKSVVPRSADEEKHLAVLNGLTSMIRSLGLIVVVEGIETEYQHKLCQLLSVPKVQGYYYCRPMAPEILEKSIQSGTL